MKGADFGKILGCRGRWGYGDGFIQAKRGEDSRRLCTDRFCEVWEQCEAQWRRDNPEPETQVTVYIRDFDVGALRGGKEREEARMRQEMRNKDVDLERNREWNRASRNRLYHAQAKKAGRERIAHVD